MSGRRARAKRKNMAAITSKSDSFNINDRVEGQPQITARPDTTGDYQYFVVPEYGGDHPLAGQKISPVGTDGEYDVTYVLAIPGTTTSFWDVNFDEILKNGDSLIQVEADKGQLQVEVYDSPDAPSARSKVEVGVNSNGRIQYLKVRVTAQAIQHAHHLSHNIIMPILSRWSYQHNVAITTSAIRIIELSTYVQNYKLSVIGATKLFSDNEGASSNEGRILLAAYREGLSTAEPLYKALCMFRVIEGSYILRQRRKANAVQNGQSYSDPAERLSYSQIQVDNPRSRRMIEQQLSQYVGQKFTALRDTFKIDIRHAVAHLDLDGNPLAADRFEDITKVRQAIPALSHMARILLAAELNFKE